jgi:hypothetical protein
MSLGTDYSSSSLEAACNRAYDSGILLVAAAGNDGNSDGTGDSVDYPANYDSVIAVTSITSSDSRSSYSSTGSAAELAAPGAIIKSTVPGEGYLLSSGTSMACPHVAGSAALVWAANPGWSNTQVRARLQETAEDLGASGRDTWYGFGLVDAEAAAIFIPDRTAPVVSEVSSEPSTYSAKITWTTDEKSDSLVKYGTEAGNLNFTVYDAAMVFSHSLVLEGLPAGTTYYYEVLSADIANNSATDNNNGTYYSFTTTAEAQANEMYVSNINMSIQKSGVNTRALATVNIVDVSGSPVEGVAVYGSWSGIVKSGDSSGVTGSNGKVTFTSGWVKKVKQGTFTFTINNVIKEGWIYNLPDTAPSASISIT